MNYSGNNVNGTLKTFISDSTNLRTMFLGHSSSCLFLCASFLVSSAKNIEHVGPEMHFISMQYNYLFNSIMCIINYLYILSFKIMSCKN